MTSRHFTFLATLLSTACSTTNGASPTVSEGRVEQAASGDLTWKGYGWNVTDGAMAGVANGDPKNVSVDADGYLHLKITKTGTAWTAAELYSTTNLGFGTYQWQISGPIDRMDHTVVLGLSPYGPAAGIGTDGFDEIDTEFSYWNDELGHVNMDWGVYPATKAGTHDEDDFFFSLNGGNSTTARIVWSSTRIVGSVMGGFVPLGSNANQLSTHTFAPADTSDGIPQQALPVLLNLWLYEAVPASGNDVEVILQDFQFIPEGQPIPDAGTVADPADAGGLDGSATGVSDGGAVGLDGSIPSNPDAGTDSDAGEDDAGAAIGDTPDADTSPDAGSSPGDKGCEMGGVGAPGNDGPSWMVLCAFLGLALARRSPGRTSR